MSNKMYCIYGESKCLAGFTYDEDVAYMFIEQRKHKEKFVTLCINLDNMDSRTEDFVEELIDSEADKEIEVPSEEVTMTLSDEEYMIMMFNEHESKMIRLLNSAKNLIFNLKLNEEEKIYVLTMINIILSKITGEDEDGNLIDENFDSWENYDLEEIAKYFMEKHL